MSGRPVGARALALPLFALAATACIPTVDLALPPTPDGAESLILALEHGDPEGSVAATRLALTAADEDVRIAVPAWIAAGDRATALYLPVSLSALGLEAGEVTSMPLSQGYPLPLELATVETARLGDGPPRWSLTTTVSEALAAVRVPGGSPATCAMSQGCLVAGLCRSPCPAPSDIAGPACPAAPALPAETTCLPGWTARTTELGATACASPALADACDPTSADLDGHGCAPVGADCPNGHWPEGLPIDRPVLYVDAAAPPGGDGSRAAPFATIGAALAELPAPPITAVVAIARGVYAEAVELPRGVELVGACARETELAGTPGPRPTVRALGGASALRGLHLGGGAGPAVQVGAPAALALDGVVIDGAGAGGVVVEAGASLDARALVVRGRTGTAILVEGTATLDRVLVEGTAGDGVLVRGAAARLEASSLFVRQLSAHALFAHEGASVTVVGARLEAPALVGLGTDLLAVTATLTATHLLDAEAGGSPPAIVEPRLAVTGAARVVLSRVLVEHVAGDAIALSQGTVLSASDLVVLGRDLDVGDDAGRSLAASEATVDVTRAAFERSAGGGLVAAGGRVRLADLSVLGPGARAGAGAAPGLELFGGALEGARLAVRGSRGVGVHLTREAAGALDDLSVDGVTAATTDETDGHLVRVDGGAQLTLQRYRGEGGVGDGLIVLGLGTAVVGSDLELRGVGGSAIHVRREGRAELGRVHVAAPGEQGIYVYGGPGDDGWPDRSQAVVQDVVVEDAPIALDAQHGAATATVERFRFARAMYGTRLRGDAVVHLADGQVTEADVGAEVGRVGYPLEWLLDRVLYSAVGAPFELAPDEP